MKKAWLFGIVLIGGWCAGAGAFDYGGWRLAFEDQFERAEVGPDWMIQGASAIVDGRLKFGGDGKNLYAWINRHFPGDVRLEFDAEAAPENSPCDLSVLLAGGEVSGMYERRYLLAFGGMNNGMHQILATYKNIPATQWMYPPKRIEHGKVYRIAGMKEGALLTLEVDGEVLLTKTDSPPMGGPNFDLAGLLTYGGMLTDNVKVYERKTPHPDTPYYPKSLKGLPLELGKDKLLKTTKPMDDPAVNQAVELYNQKKSKEAEQAFLALPDEEVRAAGVAYCVGSVYYPDTLEDCRRVGKMLIDLAASHPQDERLKDYGIAGRRFQDFTVLRASSSPDGELAMTQILALGPENNPFYDKAYLDKTRLIRAHSQESAGYYNNFVKVRLTQLKEWYPDHPGIRELTGDKILWGADLIEDSTVEGSAPAWARYLRELYARQCAVLHWWFTQRQLPDGELGGGWGDDCEILRDWGPFAVISTGDPEITAGVERLCEGMWKRLAKYGYADGFGDGPHSAEDSTDTFPGMMMLRWGDPVWIERNMRSSKTIRDYYMGLDNNGYYRFKSSFYGGERVGGDPSELGDTTFNTRTLKHLQFLALWGNQEAKRVYVSYAQGWLEQTMKAYPEKPAGVIPNQLFYPKGDIYPTWPDHPYYKDFFHKKPNIEYMMQGAFLAAYRLTSDPAFLEPTYRHLAWTAAGPLQNEADMPPAGEWGWFLFAQQHETSIDTLATFRWLTDDRAVDEYMLRFATNYQRYVVTNELDNFISGIEKTAKGLRTNFRLMTEELLQTDRAGLPGCRDSLGAYTGAFHIWRDSLMPTMAVSWEVPNTNFAGLSVISTSKRLRVWVYNFNDEPMRVGLRCWRLTPGVYTAMQGELLPGEQNNHRYGWGDPKPFTYRRTLDTYYVDVPAKIPFVVDLRLEQALNVPALAPDPAISDRDLALSPAGVLSATVHNIGSATMEKVVAVLEGQAEDETWQPIAQMETGVLGAPGFEPVTDVVTFEQVPPANAYRVVLDPENKVDELFEHNNVGTLTVEK